MIEYIELGSTPCNENCAQVGSLNYVQVAKRECRAFLNQLLREFGPEPANAKLTIRGNAHDYGTYYEVAVRYDDTDDAAIEWAFRVEGATPEQWDDIARKELGIDGDGEYGL